MSEKSINKKDYSPLAAEIKALGPHIAPPVPNPAPLALFAFGLTTALLQVKHTRLGGDSLQDQQGVDNFCFGFALFFGGLLQFVGGLHEVKRNNVFGYTGFLVYGGFWMSYGASLFFVRLANLPVNPQAVQAMLSLMGIFTFVMLICTIVMNFTISLLMFCLMMTFFLLAVGVENETVDTIGGWFGIVTSAVAYWLASVELLNDVLGGGEDIIPLGHWKRNQFRFAGVMHVPGRIHGVTQRKILMESEFGPNHPAGTPQIAKRRKSSVVQPESIPRDIEEGVEDVE